MKPIKFEKINFGSQSYQFTNRVELDQGEVEYLKFLLEYRDKNESFTDKSKTSLRLDKYLLWQLELISRVSSEKRILNNRTYGDILSNLLKHVYYPETSSIDPDTLLLPKKYLNKLYLMENGDYEVVTLPGLTWDWDYILRTIKLAIFDPHLLSFFELTLLRTILTNKLFVDKPFELRGLASLAAYNEKVVSKDMIDFLKDRVILNWYQIFNYFGKHSSETFIQQQVAYINKCVGEGKKPSPMGYKSSYTPKSKPEMPHLREFEDIDVDDKEAKELYMLNYLEDEHKQWLEHYCVLEQGFEKQFRISVALSKKQGDFMTYL